MLCPSWVSALRHPKGGSFVRPAKVSFGVDFLTAVQQVYQTDTEEVLTDASSEKLSWLGISERRYDTQFVSSHCSVWTFSQPVNSLKLETSLLILPPRRF